MTAAPPCMKKQHVNAVFSHGGLGENRTRVYRFCKPLCYHFTTRPFQALSIVSGFLGQLDCIEMLAVLFANIYFEIKEGKVLEARVLLYVATKLGTFAL